MRRETSEKAQNHSVNHTSSAFWRCRKRAEGRGELRSPPPENSTSQPDALMALLHARYLPRREWNAVSLVVPCRFRHIHRTWHGYASMCTSRRQLSATNLPSRCPFTTSKKHVVFLTNGHGNTTIRVFIACFYGIRPTPTPGGGPWVVF